MDRKIIFVLEGMHHLQHIPTILQRHHYFYKVYGNFENDDLMLRMVFEKIQGGTRVVISSGGYYEFLSRHIDIPVVSIKRSRIPFANAVKEAKRLSDQAAILARAGVFQTAAEQYKALFNDPIRLEIFENERELHEKLTLLKKLNIKVLIAGSWGSRVAPDYGFSCVTVPFEERHILEAIQEAQHILRYLEAQERTSKILKTIQNSVAEGILAVDQGQRIIEANSFILNMLGVSREELQGKLLNETSLAPVTQLPAYISRTSCRSELVTVHNQLAAVSIIPITEGDSSGTTVITAVPVKQLQQNEIKLQAKLRASGHVASYSFEQIIGSSSAIRQTIDMAKRYARVDSSVFIMAPSGCGKEMFAQSIHKASRRRVGPFVVINCAALPENLLESMLFGYEKGAFTGAAKEGRQGMFVIANHGTVFLDEISEMPLSLQSRFLRVLQEREVVPLGSDHVIPVDIRIVAATNRNMQKLIEQNQFREDLYYRLAVLQLAIPPLDERKEDIPELVRYFFYVKSQELNISCPEIDQSALTYLSDLDYPGNVRQLGNYIERLLVLYNGSKAIDSTFVQSILQPEISRMHVQKESPSFHDHEKKEIQEALLKSHGRRAEAAKLLQISTSTLWRKIKKYDITGY